MRRAKGCKDSRTGGNDPIVSWYIIYLCELSLATLQTTSDDGGEIDCGEDQLAKSRVLPRKSFISRPHKSNRKQSHLHNTPHPP
ncbi:hypothetical protein L2E82_15090 [Cichorium intybus]|uniref:Uncharacterized protein n=1 Tax=Cichorium intybus TaxID=13427 RepID=A0ACB9F268_CICIN|nr:hypothetical protein L2E82_15090 [Cichorium intybus]